MTIRLKVLRKQEERIKKIADLMNTWKVPTYPNYNYQPTGGSSLKSNSSISDPKITKTKELFQMFHLSS